MMVDGSVLCYCGKRRGLHRYGDECCPNPAWVCGNGEPQWWERRVFTPLPPIADVLPFGYRNAPSLPKLYMTRTA